MLPEESILHLDEYIAMHAAIGHRTRYELLYRLVHNGALSPREFKEILDIPNSTIHYHLMKLVDTGLIEKRKRTERGQEALETYYRVTVFGEVALSDGIIELMSAEQDFEEMYSSSSKS